MERQLSGEEVGLTGGGEVAVSRIGAELDVMPIKRDPGRSRRVLHCSVTYRWSRVM